MAGVQQLALHYDVAHIDFHRVVYYMSQLSGLHTKYNESRLQFTSRLMQDW